MCIQQVVRIIIPFSLNDVSGLGVETTKDSSSNETTADSSSTGAATWASSNETNTGASSPGAHS